MTNYVKGKWLCITGASAGIGRACADLFAANGANLILLARRSDRLKTIKSRIENDNGVIVRMFKVDVRDRKAVKTFERQLTKAGIVPDFLINNAGLASGLSLIHEGDFEDWDRMIDTNIKGLLNVTRAILPMMVKRNSGHVVNIGSIAGRMVYPKGNVYNATKYAVHALTEAMNLDLQGTKIKVSTVAPGLVETEFSIVRFRGDKKKAGEIYRGLKALEAKDVADAILSVVNTPPHVNITELVVLPTAQRNVFVVDRDT